MPGRLLPLERGGERRLRLRWSYGFDEVTAQLDDRTVATVEGREALREGRAFPLGDGTTLTLRLDRVLYPALVVERDGVPVPGSDTDPGHVARVGSWVLFFVAVIALLLGGTALLAQLDGQDAQAAAAVGLGIGLVFVVLGVLVRRQVAWAALTGAILELLDTVNATVAAIGGDASWVGVFARAAFAVILVRTWLVLSRSEPSRSEPSREGSA